MLFLEFGARVQCNRPLQDIVEGPLPLLKHHISLLHLHQFYVIQDDLKVVVPLLLVDEIEQGDLH